MTISPDQTTRAAIDRAIAFRYVFNVRDLGGLPTVDGRTVRRGQVFRADGVNRLTGDDLELARTLGLRTVIDLRTLGEVEHRGGFPVQDYEVDWHHLPVLTSMWSEDDLVATNGAVEFLRDRYLEMLTVGATSIATAITLIADATPALFHCAAGKDRTGVVAAVLLGLLGVPAEEIADDYHLSASAMAAFVDWLTLEYPEALDAMSSQPPEYMEAPAEAMLGFLETVDATYGSMEQLALQIGIEAPTIDRLRANLLTD